ncbi:MAG: aminopeptidase P family protein [Bacteroidia bacterium]|nr:MAG: aminopeptidase P family protein [Bacteroidia bacterium]
MPALLGSCAANADPVFKDETLNVVPLTADDYSLRVDKLVRSMTKNGIDAMFIEGSTNLKYFFNVSWWLSERIFGAIVNTVVNPVWICPAFEIERASEVIPEGHPIRTWEEHESAYELFATIIADLGLGSAKIGMGPTVRSFISEAIRRKLPTNLVDGSDSMNIVRAIKSENELAYMDLANNITKKAYKYGFEHLEAGMSAADLAAFISLAHTGMGVQGGGGPQFGFTSAFPHGTKQRRDLHDGDIILVDGGCSIEGFRSDVTRTIVFGKATDRQKMVFDTVLKAQRAALEAVRPGVTCGEIDRVARTIIEEAGFGPGYRFFAHRLGHGIGMDTHEYPYLVKDNDLKLEPGMTFSNEPGIYIYDEFGVRIEDCFVVTESGGRMLGGMLTESIENPFGI